MLAADTNVVVRLIAADDAAQHRKARALFAAESIWLSQTVLLETEWVLRGVYRYPRHHVIAALRAIVGLPGVILESPAITSRALDWHEAGMDFADALHLAAADHCEAFVTFDHALATAAGRPEIGRPVREP